VAEKLSVKRIRQPRSRGFAFSRASRSMTNCTIAVSPRNSMGISTRYSAAAEGVCGR
jgi:hypothetical protein